MLSPENSINVASILQSVIEKLKSMELSNSKLHYKLNRLNMSTSFPKQNTQPINLPIAVHPLSVTINKMVKRQPYTYYFFHVLLPAENFDIVLDPTFWPDGLMVKRFWGRLTPEMIQNTTSKN